MRQILLIVMVISFSISVNYAEVLTACIHKGSWLHGKTWNRDRIPKGGDTLVIPEGIEVYLDKSLDFVKSRYQCSELTILISGVLHLKKNVWLNLPEKSNLTLDKFGVLRLAENKSAKFSIAYQETLLKNNLRLTGPTTVSLEQNSALKLSEFQIENVRDTFLLEWKIAKKIDIAYYEIYVSENEKDWIKVKQQKSFGAGDSTELLKSIVYGLNYKKKLYFKLDGTTLDGSKQSLSLVSYQDAKWIRKHKLEFIPKTVMFVSIAVIVQRLCFSFGN